MTKQRCETLPRSFIEDVDELYVALCDSSVSERLRNNTIDFFLTLFEFRRRWKDPLVTLKNDKNYCYDPIIMIVLIFFVFLFLVVNTKLIHNAIIIKIYYTSLIFQKYKL